MSRLRCPFLQKTGLLCRRPHLPLLATVALLPLTCRPRKRPAHLHLPRPGNSGRRHQSSIQGTASQRLRPGRRKSSNDSQRQAVSIKQAFLSAPNGGALHDLGTLGGVNHLRHIPLRPWGQQQQARWLDPPIPASPGPGASVPSSLASCPAPNGGPLQEVSTAYCRAATTATATAVNDAGRVTGYANVEPDLLYVTDAHAFLTGPKWLRGSGPGHDSSAAAQPAARASARGLIMRLKSPGTPILLRAPSMPSCRTRTIRTRTAADSMTWGRLAATTATPPGLMIQARSPGTPTCRMTGPSSFRLNHAFLIRPERRRAPRPGDPRRRQQL